MNTSFRKVIIINGHTFILYKHFSYAGNIGVYLIDEVTKVGEWVNNKFEKIKFTQDQLIWLNDTQNRGILDIILPANLLKFEVTAIVRDKRVKQIIYATGRLEAAREARQMLGYYMKGSFFPLHWSEIKETTQLK